MEKQIHERIKRISHEANKLSSKRLLKALDYGDKFLLRDILEDLERRIIYIHQLESSKCSVVLESCGIFYGERRHD